jgi:hypothetical protein
MRPTSLVILALLATSIGCNRRQYNGSQIKEVSAYAGDYTTRVPVRDIFIRGEIARPLLKNIRFEKVVQESTGVERHWLTLSKEAVLSCHTSKVPPSHSETWKEGCNIVVFSESSDVKSVPCDDACQKSSPIFASSGRSGADHYQEVSLIGFDSADAETLLAAMTVPEITINSGIPGFFNDIPGKMISNLPQSGSTANNPNGEFPSQIFSLMCGRKSAGSTIETRCMLFTSK